MNFNSILIKNHNIFITNTIQNQIGTYFAQLEFLLWNIISHQILPIIIFQFRFLKTKFKFKKAIFPKYCKQF